MIEKAYKFHVRYKGLYIHGILSAEGKAENLKVLPELVYRKDKLYITYEEVSDEKLERDPS
jgi:hypothetical protein